MVVNVPFVLVVLVAITVGMFNAVRCVSMRTTLVRHFMRIMRMIPARHVARYGAVYFVCMARDGVMAVPENRVVRVAHAVVPHPFACADSVIVRATEIVQRSVRTVVVATTGTVKRRADFTAYAAQTGRSDMPID